jgi:signal transduction histidine kinase
VTIVQVSFVSLSALLALSALFVWRAFPQREINQWFAAFGLATACWIAGIGGVHGPSNLETWGRVTFASATLIPATFLAFIRSYPVASRWPSRSLTGVFLGAGATIAAIGLFTPLLVRKVAITTEGLSRNTGPLYPVFLTYFVVTWITALGVFFSKWRPLRGAARAQMQHLGAAILVSASGGITFNLLIPLITGRSTYSWLGPYFSIPLVLIVGHAIIRHRLLDLRVVIGRTLAQALVIGIVTFGAVTAAEFLQWPTTTDSSLQHDARLVVALLAILVMLSAPGQRVLSRLIDPYLFRSRLDYSSALRDAARRLSRLMPVDELCQELQRLLNSMFVPEAFSIFVRVSDRDSFERLAFNGPPPTAAAQEWLATTSAVFTGPRVFQVDAADPNDSLEHQVAFPNGASVDVVVLLGRRDQCLGGILLGPRRSGDAYFKDDLEFIESLSELASVALENALLYRQRLEMLEYSQRLLESLHAAVAAVDVNGTVISLNRSAASLFSVEHRSVPFGLEALPSPVAWALAIALRTSAPPRDVEVVIERAQREAIPVVLSTASLHDDRNYTRGALVVLTDLTAVKALEQNERRLEHLTLMARFYAGIAHEIRSPLTSISNFVSLLTERFDDPEYRETASKLLPLEVDRIAQLADRLRLMAPSEGAQLTSVDLGALLRDLVRLHVARSGDCAVHITLSCPAALPLIQGDPRQLIQLFLNLLNNAIEAMSSGGNIRIHVEHAKADGVSDVVSVQVRDEGHGIPLSIMGKIFQPFFTTKSSGSGLGLSICREIAAFHHATLVLRKRTDASGTVAEVRIPLAKTTVTATAALAGPDIEALASSTASTNSRMQ